MLHQIRSTQTLACDCARALYGGDNSWRRVQEFSGMTRRADLAQMDPDLAATLGLYETHRFCLRLAPEVSLLDEDGRPRTELSADVLAVLLHEYTHFLHNLSTASGFAAYQCFNHLLAVFSNALREDGTCDPTRLSDGQRAVARSALDALASLDGTRALPRHPSPVTGLVVVAARCIPVQLGEANVKQANVAWEITRRDGTRETFEGSIGAFLIEEGIAFTLEESARLGRVTFERSGDHPPPLYPYEAFRILVQHYAPDISALGAVRLGLLALSTNRPGPILLHALNAYQRLRASGADDVAACHTIRRAIDGMIRSITERICSSELGELSEMHFERGIVTEGHASVLDDFRRLLSRRATDPWFDIAWCHDNGAIDVGALSALFFNTVPCDAIQAGWGPEDGVGRDVLLTFKSDGIQRADGAVAPTAASSGLRAVQAQFEFLLAHLSPSHGIIPTQEPSWRACPFFTSCTLDMRRNDGIACRERPWVRLTKKGETCWYGVAVAATLGTLQQS